MAHAALAGAGCAGGRGAARQPTLAAADAVLAQARELYAAQAGSTRLPQVDLGLGAQRQQTSPSSQGLPGDTREFSLYSASVAGPLPLRLGWGHRQQPARLAARADIRQHELSAARQALAAASPPRRSLGRDWPARSRLRLPSWARSSRLLRLAEVRTRLGQAAPMRRARSRPRRN